MYYVYLLQYGNEERHYIGCTKNLRKRVREHRAGNGGQTTTRVSDPDKWRLIYYEAYPTKSAAHDREEKLKQYGSALQKLKKRIQR